MWKSQGQAAATAACEWQLQASARELSTYVDDYVATLIAR